MKRLYLTSPMPPSVNHYTGIRAILKDGKPLAVKYKTPEAVAYQKMFAKYVAVEAKRQKWEIGTDSEQHFYFDTVFYFGRTRQDCNNYFKCLLDAVTDSKSVWHDDCVVCERVNRIYYDSSNPRIEICVHPVEYIGIFDNMSQLEEFSSNCIGCTRYSRNCSILRNAKAGKVQEEIQDGICLKFKKKKEKKDER